MAQVKLQGVVTGQLIDSTGRQSTIVQPLDGGLSAYVYGMPNSRKGGPDKGEVVDLLLIKGSFGNNFTYVAHKAATVDDLWGNAAIAATGERKAATPKTLTAEDKAERAAKRAGFALAATAADSVETEQEALAF